MSTPYRYKLTDVGADEPPAYPDFIADVLEDCANPRTRHDVTIQRQKALSALQAIQHSLADGNDDALNRYAANYFNLGQS